MRINQRIIVAFTAAAVANNFIVFNCKLAVSAVSLQLHKAIFRINFAPRLFAEQPATHVDGLDNEPFKHFVDVATAHVNPQVTSENFGYNISVIVTQIPKNVVQHVKRIIACCVAIRKLFFQDSQCPFQITSRIRI